MQEIKKNILKVSFDFDGTLTEEPMQTLCRKFIALGADVHITTSRLSGMDKGIEFENKDLFELAKELGIPKNKVTFTNYDNKVSFVKDFDLHFDDLHEETFHINEHPSKCMGFLFEGYQDKDNGISPNF